MERVQQLDTATWPPAVLVRAAGPGQRGTWHKRAPWPARDSLEYTRLFVTVALLLLALPWLVSKLLTEPEDVLQGLGQRAAGRAAG